MSIMIRRAMVQCTSWYLHRQLSADLYPGSTRAAKVGRSADIFRMVCACLDHGKGVPSFGLPARAVDFDNASVGKRRQQRAGIVALTCARGECGCANTRDIRIDAHALRTGGLGAPGFSLREPCVQVPNRCFLQIYVGLGLCHLCTYSVRIWAAKSKAILWAASERTYTLVQQSPWEVNVSERVMVL